MVTGILILLVGVPLWLSIGLYVLYQSLYKLGPDYKIVFYNFGGSYRKTVVASSYFQREQERDRNDARRIRDKYNASPSPERRVVAQEDLQSVRGRRGNWRPGFRFLDAEFAFGLWPFRLGYRVTTTQFEVPIHASELYTDANSKTLPRVRMAGDATLQFRLSDNPERLGAVFPIFDQSVGSIIYKDRRNLTRVTCLKDLMMTSGGEEKEHEHHIQRIAKVIHHVVNKPMQEAMREASTYYTFSTSDAKNDIIRKREEFEKDVRRLVTADDGNVFFESGLLNRNGNPGVSLIVGDMIVEKLQLQPAKESDSPAIQAIDKAFIGRQEAKAQEVIEKLTRVGRADGIKALMKTLNINDAQAAYVIDMLQSSGNQVNLTQLGLNNDVLSALQSVLSGSHLGTSPAPGAGTTP